MKSNRQRCLNCGLASKSQNLKISKSQNLKIAKSQNLKISKSQNRKIAKSQNRKIAKSQNLKISKSHLIYIRFLSCNNGHWYTLQCEDSCDSLDELESFCFPTFQSKPTISISITCAYVVFRTIVLGGGSEAGGMIPHVPPKKIFLNHLLM